jgi:hypothetical protein
MTTTKLLQEAAAFVADAERMTNERDVDGIRTVFAADGHWTAILDGTHLEANGIEEIVRNWALLCDVMERRHLYVTKSLVLADEHTIVNEWTGTARGRDAARGIEVWVRDDAGLVVDQRLYTFSDVRSDSSPVQNLRMLVAHPFTATAFARARIGAHA